ncbi:alternative oxidase [Ceratobasidium sp. AG-Ba]|nr:alternative oxidase [Ceratobasidium sp. AG-Ba]QRW03465.1 alternative oxidase [Ceratobasidium sp. AG-Ba]
MARLVSFSSSSTRACAYIGSNGPFSFRLSSPWDNRLLSTSTLRPVPRSYSLKIGEAAFNSRRDSIPRESPREYDRALGPKTSVTEFHSPRETGRKPSGDWEIPVYTKAELEQVNVTHREPDCVGDRIALKLVKLCRWGFDMLSGYRSKPIPAGSSMTVAELRDKGYVMTESQWLTRIVFLETIAGVPGMVAATVRHLRSLRLMRRDAGWIHTLLEEAENERMHLMTFMSLKKPSVWFRALILGAQGVFYNAFFLGYLISPKSAHRFVGFLEEEAVATYTKCIAEIEGGRLPEWKTKAAPRVAVDYWRLPQNATLLDVVKAVRADESSHRFVNHSLANLKQTEDLNPFAIREPEMRIKGTRPE